MSVAAHLRIQIDEYDARIRTFVPNYEEMLGIVADTLRLLPTPAPTIVDLGIGTGALAARCLQIQPDAALVGIDTDAAMLEVARSRLAAHPRVQLVTGNFLETPLPPCDAIVSCISLHHVRMPQSKQAFCAACRAALRPGGLFVSADCFPARNAQLAARQHAQWRAHLEQSCTRAEAEAHLAAWADEDTYFPLADELEWLRAARLLPELVWRVGGFAVIMAVPSLQSAGLP